MRHIAPVALVVACSVTLGQSRAWGQATASLSTESVAAKAVPATVTIVTLDQAGDTVGIGSRFIVRSNGVIVTNYHVMAGATTAS